MSIHQKPFELNSHTFEKWPKITKQACEYDGETFDSIPIPRVISYDCIRKTYSVIGCFCSNNCAKSFMLNSPSITIDDVIVQEHMAITFFNTYDVKPAKSLYFLKKFGGKLNITQWRAQNKLIHNLNKPKIESKKNIEIPNIIYEKDIKAEAMIFGKCVKQEEEKSKSSTMAYGLQKYLVNVDI